MGLLHKIGNILSTKVLNISKSLMEYSVYSLVLELSLLPIGFFTTGSFYVLLKSYFQCNKFSCYKYCMGISLFSSSILVGFFSTLGQSVLSTYDLAKPTVTPVVITKSHVSKRTAIVIGFAIAVTPKLIQKIKNIKNNKEN